VRVAFEEQIFALQTYGGISRMFAELAKQFMDDPDLGVDLLPLNAPIINRYVLDNDRLFPSGYSYLYLTRDGPAALPGGTAYYYPSATRGVLVTLDVVF
jgi:hypothetical protein